MRWRKISLLWLLSIGQKVYGLENGQLNKKKLGRIRLLKSKRGGK